MPKIQGKNIGPTYQRNPQSTCSWSKALLRRILIIGSGLSVSEPTWAIPSPDLVISLSASAAQVLGLFSMIFGGVAFSFRGRFGNSANSHRSTRRWPSVVMILGLLAAVIVIIFQYTHYSDSTQQRLHTNLIRSSVENGKKVGDISLKTLSFSDQQIHPQGLQTEDLAHWISSGRALHMLDVR